MSQENVEIVRRVFAFAGHDLDANLEFIDADAVFDWTASRAPYSGLYRGHAEIRRFWQGFMEAWGEWTIEVQEAIEVDSETIVCATHFRARGKGSGVVIEGHGASVWSVRDSKVIRATLFQNRTEALEAAGLSE
jgi:ketosteroid isomerase-like protein